MLWIAVRYGETGKRNKIKNYYVTTWNLLQPSLEGDGYHNSEISACHSKAARYAAQASPSLHSCNSSAAWLHSEFRLQSLNKKGGKRGRKKMCIYASSSAFFSYQASPPIVVQSQPRLPISPINHSPPSRCEQQGRAASHPGAAAEPVPTNVLELGVAERRHTRGDKDMPRRLNRI